MNEFVDPQEWRLRSLERRIKDIEDTHPAVLADRVANLSRQMTAMTRAFYGLMIAIVTASLGIVITLITTRPGL